MKPRESRLRIVVTGLAVTYPFGGSFWDYVQYPLGLLRMGHDVVYLEDTGQWCYDANRQTYVESGAANAERFRTNLAQVDEGLVGRWHFRDARKQCFGLGEREVFEFCASADLFLHLSAACQMRDEYLAAGTVAMIDSDPMYTQASMLARREDPDADDRWRADFGATRFFTFGECIGEVGCLVPDTGTAWMPTRQPIVMDCFSPHRVAVPRRRRSMTTVASWEPHQDGPVVDGVQYTGKSTELLRFLGQPSRSAVPLELAISGRAPTDRLVGAGWRVRDALPVSRDPWVYRRYLAGSFGEWSVAKNAYAAGRTGWFSCRTACYLALGVPAAVQDTGFRDKLPTGLGLLAFTNIDDANDAIADIAAEPKAHSNAAHEIAAEYFDHRRVLTDLIDRALEPSPVGVAEQQSSVPAPES